MRRRLFLWNRNRWHWLLLSKMISYSSFLSIFWWFRKYVENPVKDFIRVARNVVAKYQNTNTKNEDIFASWTKIRRQLWQESWPVSRGAGQRGEGVAKGCWWNCVQKKFQWVVNSWKAGRKSDGNPDQYQEGLANDEGDGQRWRGGHPMMTGGQPATWGAG